MGTAVVEKTFLQMSDDERKDHLLFILRLQQDGLLQIISLAEQINENATAKGWADTNEGKAFYQALRGLREEQFVDVFQDQVVQLRKKTNIFS